MSRKRKPLPRSPGEGDKDTDDDGVGDYFDWLEGSNKIMSGEASVVASPGGDFFYALWNQETLHRRGNVIASDAWVRRVMNLDEDTTRTPASGEGGERAVRVQSTSSSKKR
ncbi:MAG: hypothetical protein KJ804_22485 [Proteobacteria bacterium]|nr:hypothetical protein [Pseudomonadota bacterium]MBU1061078.1 hypothetical protein [Pseudomonadota bacterium]